MKLKIRLHTFICLFLCTTYHSVYSDESSINSKAFFKARAYYVNQNYIAAQQLFNELAYMHPANPVYKRYLDLIVKALPDSNNSRITTRTGMLEAVEEGWSLNHSALKQETEPNELISNSDKTLSLLDSTILDQLSFKDTPLNEVISILSDSVAERVLGGINIVLINPEEAMPTITLNVRAITLRKALELVLQAAQFLYDIEDGIVVVRPVRSSRWNLETVVFPVSRATIIRLTHTSKNTQKKGDTSADILSEEVTIKQFFQKAGIDFDAVDGSNLAFDGSQLIVTHAPRYIQRIRNLLSRYQSIGQVEIEAKFLEVQEGALEEIGFEWSAKRGMNIASTGGGATSSQSNLRTLGGAYATQAFSNGNGQVILNTGAGTNSRHEILNQPPRLPNAVNLANSALPLMHLYTRFNKLKLDVMIRALEQHSNSDLMSAPKLTVLSGKTAHIVIAQELRYPQAYGNVQSEVGANNLHGGGGAGVTIVAGTPKDFTMRNIGVEMDVTPTVEHNQTISLCLEPKVTEFEGFIEYGGQSLAISNGTSVSVPSGFFQPIFSTRQIQTEVTVFDGATVVMGGLTREEIKEVHDKIPILGDIPLIGKLFQSNGETVQKRNLLIFVTANLVSPSGMLSRNQ